MAPFDIDTTPKPFIPGTTGWTAADLEDPAIETQWFEGRYEIVEGVLTLMAPAYFYGHESGSNLMSLLREHVRRNRLGGGFSFEVDIVVDSQRVLRADLVYLSRDDKRKQAAAAAAAGKSDVHRTRVLIPPTLIIEVVSPGHERHDRKTKFAWYAEMGVANYWLLEPFEKSLTCYTLKNGVYDLVATGQETETISAPPFADFPFRMSEVWPED